MLCRRSGNFDGELGAVAEIFFPPSKDQKADIFFYILEDLGCLISDKL